MGKSSRTKRRASVSAARRSRSGLGWYALAGVIVVAGVIGIMLSRSSSADEAPFANQDHWHAAFGVNVCGEWLPNAPTFENAEGIHTHGDGLIHIHPFISRAAGENATVGKYFDLGGWEAGTNSFRLWDDEEHKSGDECGGEEATVRWELNGEPMDGNISDFKPEDGDVIALALLPEGQEIGEPPSVSELAAPSDVPTDSTGATTQTTVAPTETTVAPTETTTTSTP